jgi:hypothetical protein
MAACSRFVSARAWRLQVLRSARIPATDLRSLLRIRRLLPRRIRILVTGRLSDRPLLPLRVRRLREALRNGTQAVDRAAIRRP